MGADPKTSVVSPHLQHWDSQNLFVVGASVYPHNSGFNPTGPLSALAAGLVTYAARALRHRRLAFAVSAEPVDVAVDALRVAARKAFAAELEARIRAAIAGGHLPEQDAAAAAGALVGLMVEGLIGPLAPSADAAKARDTVQTVTLLALRALGVVDARARGLVVQTAVPEEDAA